MLKDDDLRSIQEVRDLVSQVKKAQAELSKFSQQQIDTIIKRMADSGYKHAESLARHAVEETGFGKYEDKVVKNKFATQTVYEFIRPMKTVGIINEDPIQKVVEIAEPMGVVAAIVPSTNPTSTAMYKSLISVKSRNGVVISPHPKAAKCTLAAAKVMAEAAESEGAPKGIIGCMSIVTIEGTNELMRHKDTGVILATGGTGLVRAAYSAGKPAYGVGPGNVPAYIDRTADIRKAVRDIIVSKTFDNGTICASEQAIVADAPIKDEVVKELKDNGAYFLNKDEIKRLESVAITHAGTINPGIVGQPAEVIAKMADISVPTGTTVLIAELEGVGKAYPLSMEKLSPILGFYTERDWVAGCERCIEILNFGGIGHTLVIHCNDEKVIMEFGLKKPAFRIIVNSPASQGAIGATTGLAPALTLGCGTWGGTITTDNITPMHLINIKRVAYGIKEYEPPVPSTPVRAIPTAAPIEKAGELHRFTESDIEKIIADFLKEVKS